MNPVPADDVDRAIMAVARALTATHAAGFRARVQERLQRRRRAWWMPFTWTAVAAGLVLFAAANLPRPLDLPNVPSGMQASARIAGDGGTLGAPSRVAVARTRGGTRRSRTGDPPAVVEAERAWLQRAVPGLIPAAPIVIEPVAPDPLEVPALNVGSIAPPDGGR